MTDKEKILQEIERLIAIEEETSHLDKISFNSGRWKVLTQLMVFIDSLQNEDPSDECPCCDWALDSDGCCGSCGKTLAYQDNCYPQDVYEWIGGVKSKRKILSILEKFYR